jgi:hypothetical protein
MMELIFGRAGGFMDAGPSKGPVPGCTLQTFLREECKNRLAVVVINWESCRDGVFL